ncbi:MAG TPA: HAMP domain-containing sensor histidine kinase [Solirubrobacteraceae bacterium]|jgi:signal transduction histidine kinase
MKRPPITGLRGRLLLITFVGSLLALSALVLAFNVILDARLRGEVDNLLRAQAAAQLRTIGVLDGRLDVQEAPDNGVPDTQTWVFAGATALEQPAGVPAENRRAALALAEGTSAVAAGTPAPGAGTPALAAGTPALAAGTHRLLTVQATRTRLYAVPILQSSRRLGTLVVGASLRPYDNSAHTALLGSLILGALTVLGIAALSTWVIGRALAPVARMTATAADWGEHDLSRRFLAGEPHDELSELAATFDRLLDRLAQSLEREQRFTAEISHELRTPLAKILAEAELAEVRESTPEDHRRALGSIRRSAESLGGALDALLTSARANNAGRSSSTEACAAAERAAQQVSRQAPENTTKPKIVVRTPSATAGVGVAAEPELIERALMPLVENAARFATHRVDISIASTANRVIFEVHDDGPGVDPAIRERIFEPGVSQGNPNDGSGSGNNGSGTGNDGSGAGLGLPLARRLAHAAGGDIDCVPTGDGATFVLRLPRS